MLCHKNHNNENDECVENQVNEKKGILSHGLLMIICCAIPLVLLFLLPYINIRSSAIQGFLGMGVFLLCPLMHLGMMYFMTRGNKKGAEKKSCH